MCCDVTSPCLVFVFFGGGRIGCSDSYLFQNDSFMLLWTGCGILRKTKSTKFVFFSPYFNLCIVDFVVSRSPFYENFFLLKIGHYVNQKFKIYASSSPEVIIQIKSTGEKVRQKILFFGDLGFQRTVFGIILFCLKSAQNSRYFFTPILTWFEKKKIFVLRRLFIFKLKLFFF
jgi:hypothetical protein